jgi:hypothetical protein
LKNFSLADCLIDIDELSNLAWYRTAVIKKVGDYGISDLDFFDCRIRQRCFFENHDRFYSNIENKVHELLTKECGYSDEDVSSLTRRIHKPFSLNPSALRKEIEMLRQEIRNMQFRHERVEKSLYEMVQNAKIMEDSFRWRLRDITNIGGILKKVFSSSQKFQGTFTDLAD